MDIFTRFNRKGIQDRQIDTLIGLSKGIVADGEVNQQEAEFLMNWLIQSRQASNNPVVMNLLEKVSTMLEDGIFEPDEQRELLNLLHKITGGSSETGELGKSTTLPVDDPMPSLEFQGKSFLFTGTCAYGSRRQCHDATRALGGDCATGVTKSLDYLVVGTYVTDSWAHETYGRKIEKAVKYRDGGLPLAIVTEGHWVNEGALG